MNIIFEINNKKYKVVAEEIIDTPHVVNLPSRYVMLNCINWNNQALNNLPIKDTSECTYFVLPVSSNGTLLGGNTALENKFVADIHSQGKKATFSVAGGSQNVADITNAVLKNKTNFIDNIASRIIQFGYDGVTIDIENTNLAPLVVADFINSLRNKLNSIRPNLIIGMYTQPYQLSNVMSKLELCASSLTWLAPMIYDFNYTLDELKKLTLDWLPKVGGDKNKLLCGIAVNYATGLNVSQYGEVLDWVNSQNLKGVGIWENTLFNQQYIDMQRFKFQNIQ